MVCILAGFGKILEAGMTPHLLHGHRTNLFRDQPGEPFVNRHAQLANAFLTQPEGRGQNQIGAVGSSR